MVDVIVVFLKIAALVLLGFGAYVCIARRDRRVRTSPTVRLKRRQTDADQAVPVVHITDATGGIGQRDKLAA